MEVYDDREENIEESPYDLQDPYQGAVLANQDQGFLKWLFDFRKEAIIPLRNSWRGKEFNFKSNTWEEGKSELRVMNEDGITWGISLIESYMNPVFIVSDFDDKSYNFTMREVSKVIWNNLTHRYQEFDLKKTDIPRVAEEIESKIRAILLGAKDNGYRDFFSTQHQSIESKNLNEQSFNETRKSSSIFQPLANMFKRLENQQNYR